jgi:uncharacterized SAM-binding protein YcdF (DUF218 family)
VLVFLAAGLMARDPDRVAAWLVLEDPAVRTDAVVVMAGDPGYERTHTAARLVLSGEARLLVLTGGEAGPGDSSSSLREQAILAGVPPERIRIEETSSSTRTSLLAVRSILRDEGIDRITLVTSPYHQRRAFLAARRALPGVEIRNRPAESSWSPQRWWAGRRSRHVVIREYAALGYYWLRGWL